MQGSLRLLLVVWLRSSLAAYTNLYIGALINAFNADNGKVNEAGSHQLAAFVMAVNEINNKIDGVADDLLRLVSWVL